MQLYLPKVAEGSFSTVKTATASKFITCACLDPLERRNVFSCSLVGVIHTRVSRNALVYTCYRRVMTQETKNTKNKKNRARTPAARCRGAAGSPFPTVSLTAGPGARRPAGVSPQPGPAGARGSPGPPDGGAAGAQLPARGRSPLTDRARPRGAAGEPQRCGPGGERGAPRSSGTLGVTLFLAGAVG